LGADGIAYDNAKGPGQEKGRLYVNNVMTGALVRIPITQDGTAGPVVEIHVEPPLNGPDGMRMLGKDTLIVAEGPANRVSKITVTGDKAIRATLSDKLLEPSSVTVVAGDAWVSEGQIPRLFATPPADPKLPFDVRRVRLP
jgi:hypothetical protein